MKRVALLLFACTCTLQVLAAPPVGFEERVEGLRKEAGVPGMAIAIVEDQSVTLAKGFGVRGMGSPVPADADTIFPTGSTGNDFTVEAIPILVYAGKIGRHGKVS